MYYTIYIRNLFLQFIALSQALIYKYNIDFKIVKRFRGKTLIICYTGVEIPDNSVHAYTQAGSEGGA